MAVGFAVRLVVVLVSADLSPHDFADSFRYAGEAVRGGVDPLTALPEGLWNFTPLMAMLYAAILASPVPWLIGGKLPAIVADTVIVAIVAKLAPERQVQRAWIYALNPVAIIVSGVHGQIDPVVLAFVLGALATTGRARGLLFGTAVAIKTWPALLAPAVVRDRVTAVWALVVPAAALLVQWLLGTPPIEAAWRIATYSSTGHGRWGWVGVYEVTTGAAVFPYMRLASVALLAILAVVAVRFYRRPDVELSLLLVLTFLVFTAGFGVQYVLWPVPFLVALLTPRRIKVLLCLSIYAVAAYIPNVGQVDRYGSRWVALVAMSVVAIALIIDSEWPALRRSGPGRRAGGGVGAGVPGGHVGDTDGPA